MNIIYVRVSTEAQARSGLGMEAQEASCRAYCEMMRWRVDQIIVDAGISGKNFDRPGWSEVVALVESGRARRVIAYKFDRLIRSVAHFGTMVEWFDRFDASLVSVMEQFDLSTPMGRFAANILVAAGQLERELASERTRAAIQAKRARGERLGGRAPVGFAIEGGEVVALVESDEWRAGRRAADLRGDGWTLRRIATLFSDETVLGRSQWHPSGVQRLMRGHIG